MSHLVLTHRLTAWERCLAVNVRTNTVRSSDIHVVSVWVHLPYMLCLWGSICNTCCVCVGPFAIHVVPVWVHLPYMLCLCGSICHTCCVCVGLFAKGIASYLMQC
jgi:hypothetical protein